MENKPSISIFEHKPTLLFIILGGFFIANTIFAEFLGVKIFSVERTFGLNPIDITLFGKQHISLNMTAGVLNWPIVFIMTDIINEYYGKKGVQFLSVLTAGLIAYGFLMFGAGIALPPADFWPTSHLSGLTAEQTEVMKTEVGNFNSAFGLVFGQSMWIIVGSLTAFLLSQLVDVATFHQIKKVTGENRLWLRSTGSTLISQFVDSFVVLFVAFYIPGKMDFMMIIALGLVAYTYKLVVAILMTPVIYLVHNGIEKSLGIETATALKHNAANK